MASALLGFARESYIAYRYGASGHTDAFYIAAVIPDLLATVIGYALSNALVPVLKRERAVSPASARRLAAAAALISLALLSGLALAAFGLRGEIVRLLAPGFNPPQRALAGRFLAVMSFAVIPCGFSGVLWGFHNALDRTALPALGGLAHNAAFLLVAAALAGRDGIESLAWALLAGFGARCLIQAPPLLRRLRPLPAPAWWHPRMRGLMAGMSAILAGDAIVNLNLTVDRILSSSLSPGQMTLLNVANKLGFIPVTLVTVTVAAAFYPVLVNLVLSARVAELRRQVLGALAALAFTGWQVAAAFGLLGVGMIALLFGHGRFTPADVRAAAVPLFVYGLGMPCYLAVPLILRVFFAAQSSSRILVLSAGSAGLNIVAAVILVHPWGIAGLVAANALSQAAWVTTATGPLARLLGCGRFDPAKAFLSGSLPAWLTWVPVLLIAHAFPGWLAAPLHLAGLTTAGFAAEAGIVWGYASLRPRHPLFVLMSGRESGVPAKAEAAPTGSR